MKLTIAVLAAVMCLANSVPLPDESIDLVNIPLSDNKVSFFCIIIEVHFN